MKRIFNNINCFNKLSMKYILIILVTIIIPQEDKKKIELKIPFSSKQECLEASEKIDFSLSFSGAEIKTNSKCIPEESNQKQEDIET